MNVSDVNSFQTLANFVQTLVEPLASKKDLSNLKEELRTEIQSISNSSTGQPSAEDRVLIDRVIDAGTATEGWFAFFEEIPQWWKPSAEESQRFIDLYNEFNENENYFTAENLRKVKDVESKTEGRVNFSYLIEQITSFTKDK